MSARPVSLRRPTPPEGRGARDADRAAVGLALLVAGAAALAYAMVAHPDWLVDPLPYAVLTQRGHASGLFGPQHVLGNMLPFATYRASLALGYGGGALPIQAAIAIAATAACVGLTFLAARRLGASMAAAIVAAAGLAVTA